ncbi:rod-binding protein [Paracoccus sp. Z330]|uniref:Rod-binding protein n=1 Tax=Paracoccus onchidii TaxID=3017813 RepID=A0ABT4ZJ42_9RHOB|nr:rod-binding protein [Paracoccus onchidii]MDB6179224.1 rod-binding protein [Paracoccus onchidii]
MDVVQVFPVVSSHARSSVGNRLEEAFLEEMLKYCGPGPSEGAFSGGAGEGQFSSFLNREYASMMAEKLDLGLGLTPGGHHE